MKLRRAESGSGGHPLTTANPFVSLQYPIFTDYCCFICYCRAVVFIR